MSDSTPVVHQDPRLRLGGLPDMASPGGGAAYGEMIDALRALLDTVADAKPDEATSSALARDLAAWTDRLAPLAAPEAERIFGRRFDLVGRGQTLAPPYTVDERAPGLIKGTVVFGSYYLGANGAAYGGALPLLFDDVLGIIANETVGTIARTAYLHIDYRSIVPIGRPLRFHGWSDREEGRKRWVRGTLTDGDRLCCDAETLFVELKPGAP